MNILEIVGHVADTEHVFGYRVLRIARADPVMWTAVEFPDHTAAANFGERPLGDLVAELTAVRAARRLARARTNNTLTIRGVAYQL